MQPESEGIDRALAGTSLFGDLEPACLAALAPHCRLLTYQRGETIFRKGDRAEGFYLVLEGLVKLYFVSERGNEKIVEVLKPKMTFGEAVVFIGEPYPVTAEALQPSRLLYVQRDGLFETMNRNEQMAPRLLAGLSRRLHSLIGNMEAVCVLTSRERVIGYLLSELADSPDNRISLPATKAVVASTLNLTPETFSRVLHALEKEEIIGISGRDIEIKDPVRLRDHAAC